MWPVVTHISRSMSCGEFTSTIAGVLLAAADVVLQRLEQRPAFGMPEHRAGRFLLEMEQVHLAAEPAVVALLGFLDLLEVGVELFLLGEGGAVDAGEHRVVAVAAPIGAGHLHQLEGVADLGRRGHVRAAAEIEPVALLVNFDRLVFRNGVDQLDLEILAHVAEGFLGLLARPDFLGEGSVARDDLLHLLLDDGQVFQRERLVAGEVVIKAVLDHRADGDLRARPQRLHGFRHNVRGVVPDQLQRARVVARDEFDLGVALDRVGEVGDRAVERHRHGALGQRGRNALGDIEPGGALGVVPARAVGKGQRDHVLSPVAHSLPTNAGKRDSSGRDIAADSAVAIAFRLVLAGMTPGPIGARHDQHAERDRAARSDCRGIGWRRRYCCRSQSQAQIGRGPDQPANQREPQEVREAIAADAGE